MAGDNIAPTAALLPDPDDPSAGLKGTLRVGGHIQEDNVAVVLLQIERGGADPEARDQDLDRILLVIESGYRGFSVLLLVLRADGDSIEDYDHEQDF